MPTELIVGLWAGRDDTQYVSLTKRTTNKAGEVVRTKHFAIDADQAERVGQQVIEQGKAALAANAVRTISMT